MTNIPTISRRNTFLFGLAAASSTLSNSPIQASHDHIPASLDWDDPRERARIQAAVKGSSSNEKVYSFFRLHIYAYTHKGNLVPLVTMSNLNIGYWKPLENGNYGATIYEAGIYTKFDSHEVLEEFENPITKKKRKPWRFLGGPLSVEIGPDGIVTGAGATLKPKPMQIQVFGDTVMLPTASAFSFPNPITPKAFPEESSGDIIYWDSHYVFFANLKDVVNKSISNIQSNIQFQNLVSFHPWLGLGGVDGRSWGRAYGTKVNSLDQIPDKYLRGLEQQTPEIFDIENWKEPVEDYKEYIQERLL